MFRFKLNLPFQRAACWFLSMCGAIFLAPHAAEANCANSSDNRLVIWCAIERSKDNFISAEYGREFSYALSREGYVALDRVDLDHSTTVAPSLSYSSNLNGGNPAGTLQLGEVNFYPDERYILEKGFLIGGAVGTDTRKIIGAGRYLSLETGLSVSFSPQTEDWVKAGHASVCTKNHVTNWWYIDGCAEHQRSEKTLAESSTTTTSAAVSKAFSTSDKMHHLATAKVERKEFDDYGQFRGGLELQSIHPQGFFTHIDYSVGDKSDDGQLKTRHNYLVELAGIWREKRFGVFGELETRSGGNLAGYKRKDKFALIGVAFQLSGGWSVKAGYSYLDSSIDYYDSRSPVFYIGSPAYRF